MSSLPTQHFWHGALLIVAAEFMFASMGASIRMIADEINNPMVVFARNLVGLVVVLPWLLHAGLGNVGTRVPHLHLLRGLAGVGAMYCFYYAIAHIPLADAMVLKLSAPLFIPFIAYLWLRERFTWHLLLALLIGFLGVTIIVVPDLNQGVDPIALIALTGGALAALAKVTVRRLRHSEPASRIVFYFALIGLFVSITPLIWFWVTPTATQAAWLLLIGLLASAGQILLTRGMGLAPAAHLAPFTFFAVLFGAAFGWLFWEEAITLATTGGALLILASALLTGKTQSPSTRSPLKDHA